MNGARTYLLYLCLFGSFKVCTATITIDSVVVTSSTCPNNGTATLFAASTNPNAVFLYTMVSGPVVYPLQNDSVFYSLYPGAYTAWVHDVNSFDSTQVTFTISGNYQAPAVTATETAPLCFNGTDGRIVGRLVPATGIPPYNWQIISPYTGTPQVSDTFNNLAAGTYVVKLTDGCSVARTVSAIVDTGGVGLAVAPNNPILTFIHCHTAAYTVFFYLDNDKAYLPLNVSLYTSTGTIVKSLLPQPLDTSVVPSTWYITDTLNNINYGDYLKACITDTCNYTICLQPDTVAPFNFVFTYISSATQCITGYTMNISLSFNPNEIFAISDYNPITVTLQNGHSGTVVDSFEVIDSNSLSLWGCSSCLAIPPQSDTVPYLLSIKDTCGNIFQKVIQWPAPPAVTATVGTWVSACIDSTTSSLFTLLGWGSAVTIELVSGPPVSESSKPGFAYHSTLVYPMVFNDITTSQFTINNMPKGEYVYRVSDSCGHLFVDSFRISNVISLNNNLLVHYNCNGSSTFEVNHFDGQLSDDTLNSLSSGGDIPLIVVNNSLYQSQPLYPGSYKLQVNYFASEPAGEYATLTGNNCWDYRDTIVIPYYSDSTIKTTDVAACNGITYIHIEVDSANGVLPFKYEIISGPETFAAQDSATFAVQSYGTYLLGVIDSCGNVNTRQITIDTGRFSPAVESGGLCTGSAVQLAEVTSPYFTYVWHRPGGGTFTGDTLVINPVTAADTGVYHITKIVSINGCTDSAYGSYSLVLKDTFQQGVSFCPGDTLHIGPHNYTNAGIYYDTLTGAYGCDSIEVTTLSLLGAPQVLITPSGPLACRTTPITLTASGADAYAWSTAADTPVITVNPGAIATYLVTATGANSCSATASIEVYPVGRDSVQLNMAFCSGDTFHVGTHAYTQSGNYIDTLTGLFGCDSIVYRTLTALSVPPVVIAPANPPMCHYYPVTLTASGATNYKWQPGNVTTPSITVNPTTVTVYTVTASDTSLCPATASVTVYPESSDSTVDLSPAKSIICPGDSATICAAAGFNSYAWNNGGSASCITISTPGSYQVTATNGLGCTVVSGVAQLAVYSPTPVIVSVNGDTLTCFHDISYQWYYNNAAIPGDTSFLIIARASGSYTVQVTDSNGCTYFSTPIVVEGINDGLLRDESIRVYPNPNTTGNWQLEISEQLVGSLCEVFDVEGKTVYNSYLTSAKSMITLNTASAIYIMRISSAKRFYNLKLVQF